MLQIIFCWCVIVTKLLCEKMADHFPAQVVRGCHSFHLQVVSLTSQFADINKSRSFCLHGLSRFAYIKVVSPTFICRNILWRWTDEHHCLQLADWSRIILTEILQLLAEEGNDFWFESSEGLRNGGFYSLICSLCPVRLLWWKGSRKENHATAICKTYARKACKNYFFET